MRKEISWKTFDISLVQDSDKSVALLFDRWKRSGNDLCFCHRRHNFGRVETKIRRQRVIVEERNFLLSVKTERKAIVFFFSCRSLKKKTKAKILFSFFFFRCRNDLRIKSLFSPSYEKICRSSWKMSCHRKTIEQRVRKSKRNDKPSNFLFQRFNDRISKTILVATT